MDFPPDWRLSRSGRAKPVNRGLIAHGPAVPTTAGACLSSAREK